MEKEKLDSSADKETTEMVENIIKHIKEQPKKETKGCNCKRQVRKIK